MIGLNIKLLSLTKGFFLYFIVQQGDKIQKNPLVNDNSLMFKPITPISSKSSQEAKRGNPKDFRSLLTSFRDIVLSLCPSSADRLLPS